MKKGIFSLLLTLFASNPILSSKACSDKFDITMTRHDGFLEIRYRTPLQLEQITLGAPASLSDIFSNSITTKHVERVKLAPDANGNFSTEPRPLGKYIDAVYTPYLKLEDGYGHRQRLYYPHRGNIGRRKQANHSPRMCTVLDNHPRTENSIYTEKLLLYYRA